ncbi:hypothetical protein MKQ68_05905 [Chitinophaga horti]|uniref:Uncharacterized protein n=1 Tax=Chitinophaga horti TaxID=2920382 RepID=A0ABY6J4M6_9BACT|nr:hypothetical protein [Chitinophaga horti]UYQ94625.1 hypothetical protein MKQ68_05905 [Chitinophaga horti]
MQEMEELVLGVGSRVQHTQYGPGVIIGVKYAQYVVTFMNEGIREVDKTDPRFEVLNAENKTVEVETVSEVEASLLKILRLWGGFTETVKLGDRWTGGTLVMQPKDATLKAKEVPIDVFFHKIVMVRDRLRVLEQQINAHKLLSDEDKVNMQQYITRIYGSLTTFNVLFRDKEHWFTGEKGSKEE